MKYIKLFENIDITQIVSNKFWKMVNIVDWTSVIEGYRKSPTYHADYVNWYEQAQGRLYSNYTFDEVREFGEEYKDIDYKLYDEFNSISDKCHVSDDGYTDLISSIVGKGKEWVKKCVKEPKLVIKMGKKNDYMENFGYLFGVSQDEYWNIFAKFNPDNIRVVARKYNL